MVTGGADLTPDGEFSPLCPSSENESYEHFPQGIMVMALLDCYCKKSHFTKFVSPTVSYFYYRNGRHAHVYREFTLTWTTFI